MLDIGKENVVVEIVNIIKRGDLIHYKLINKFLTLENGNTMHKGKIHYYEPLGTQLRAIIKPENINLEFFDETLELFDQILENDEEIHIKLLRLLTHYSREAINNATSDGEKERLSNNILLNYHTILLGRDNVPMDENGNLPEEYQKMITKYSNKLKEGNENNPEKHRKMITELFTPQEKGTLEEEFYKF